MSKPSVAILLCTYNGEAFLVEQLQSIREQSWTNWQLWVSDDGSQDGTVALLQKTQEEWGEEKMKIRFGPRHGVATNFLALATAQEIDADYYAYCDQDDIWQPDKLRRALKTLRDVADETPALYGTRTLLIDEHGTKFGASPFFDKKPSFANALVQCIAGGNTMVFNRAARKLLCFAGSDINIPAHDWWTYLLVSGCGGTVIYDGFPSVLYRQHGDNQVGSNRSFNAQWMRASRLWQGDFCTWNERNIHELEAVSDLLTEKNQKMLEQFDRLRKVPLGKRLRLFWRSGLYRQTLGGNLGLLAAVVAGKL
jgi:Glycosyltransferases involved in cell wall biogenesis